LTPYEINEVQEEPAYDPRVPGSDPYGGVNYGIFLTQGLSFVWETVSTPAAVVAIITAGILAAMFLSGWENYRSIEWLTNVWNQLPMVAPIFWVLFGGTILTVTATVLLMFKDTVFIRLMQLINVQIGLMNFIHSTFFLLVGFNFSLWGGIFELVCGIYTKFADMASTFSEDVKFGLLKRDVETIFLAP